MTSTLQHSTFCREAAKAAVFGLGFLAGNLLLSWAYLDVIMASSLLNRCDRQFEEHPERIDVLVMGDSHAQASVDPRVFDSAFNFASSGESYTQTYYKLAAVLEDPDRQIRCIVLPADLHSFSSMRRDRIENPAYWVQHMDFLKVGRERGRLPRYVVRYGRARFVPYLGEADNVIWWLDRYVFDDAKTDVHPLIDGFLPKSGQFGVMTATERAGNADGRARWHFAGKDPLDADFIAYLDKSLALCREHEVGVVLVTYPVTRAYAEAAAPLVSRDSVHTTIQDLAERYPEAHVFDFLEAFSDQGHLFSDSDHLNEQGARVFSAMLEDRLADAGLLDAPK